jgi:integrase
MEMATFRRRPGGWRAEVFVQGRRRSKTLRTKAEAAAWAMQQEAELSGKALPSKTLAQAMDRYASEVSPTHRGERWERFRLKAIRDGWDCSKLSIASISGPQIADWRDSRLAANLAPATVARELTLLRSVFEVSRRDWGWIRDNPMKGLRWPKSPPARRRRVPDAEVDAMLAALKYRRGERPITLAQQVAVAFLLALETAMRSGEILGLRWSDVREKAVTLPRTKNGDARDVPLSAAARSLLALPPRDRDQVFSVTTGTRDALWRKARATEAAKEGAPPELAGLHFHDARAEAIWRLSKKLDVLELARVIGHRDPRSLVLYYNTPADELADRL